MFVFRSFLIDHSFSLHTMEKELATIVEEEIDEEEINKLYDTGNVEK